MKHKQATATLEELELEELELKELEMEELEERVLEELELKFASHVRILLLLRYWSYW